MQYFDLYKVFRTSKMPQHIADALDIAGYIQDDGFLKYTIGYTVTELEEEPLPKDPEELEIAKEEIKCMKAVDKWLIAAGAKNDEEVIIEHG